MSKTTKQNSQSSVVNRLKAHGGRFLGLRITNSRGTEKVCARVVSMSNSQLRYFDVNQKRNRVANLSNVSVG